VSQHLTSRQAEEFTLTNPLEEDILENSIAALQAVNIEIALKGTSTLSSFIQFWKSISLGGEVIHMKKGVQIYEYVCSVFTDKKKLGDIVLIYKEIWIGAGEKLYMYVEWFPYI
jgi:hypothetical protein